MQIIVKIDIPEIFDPDSDEATFAIHAIEEELNCLSYNWYIDDVIGQSLE